MNDSITILVVSRQDDDRRRITDILSEQKEFLIVGEEKDEAGVIIRAEKLKPNIIIIDLQFENKAEFELINIIRRKTPSSAIILLSDNDENNYVCFAVKSGIAGFLLKSADFDKLTLIVKLIYLNGYYISGSIFIKEFSATAFTSQFPGNLKNQNPVIFSPAERSIVTDLAHGLSDDQIANHLHYSKGAVKNNLSGIKRRIKLKNRIQIVFYSLMFGLIDFDYIRFLKNIDNYAFM